MENNQLTFEDFKVGTHDKVGLIVQGHKNLGNTLD
jgi:hypothetical protein